MEERAAVCGGCDPPAVYHLHYLLEEKRRGKGVIVVVDNNDYLKCSYRDMRTSLTPPLICTTYWTFAFEVILRASGLGECNRDWEGCGASTDCTGHDRRTSSHRACTAAVPEAGSPGYNACRDRELLGGGNKVSGGVARFRAGKH